MTLRHHHAAVIAVGFVSAGLATGFAAPVQAQTVIGLVAGKTLVMLDAASGEVTKTVAVSGAGDLLGIDVIVAIEKVAQSRLGKNVARSDENERSVCDGAEGHIGLS